MRVWTYKYCVFYDRDQTVYSEGDLCTCQLDVRCIFIGEILHANSSFSGFLQLGTEISGSATVQFPYFTVVMFSTNLILVNHLIRDIIVPYFFHHQKSYLKPVKALKQFKEKSKSSVHKNNNPISPTYPKNSQVLTLLQAVHSLDTLFFHPLAGFETYTEVQHI